MSNEVAPPPCKTYSAEAFEIEKNAKNKAYTFIIACGLLDKYHEFCQKFADIDDWHAAAVMLLEKAAADKQLK